MTSDPYRTLFERSADAILIIEGNTFVDCNQATVEMLRYRDKAELLKTHPSELSPKYQRDGRLSYEKANEMMSLAFLRGSHRFEWDHMRADGEIFPVEVLLTAVSEGDRRILHVVWRDITNRKRLEEDLRHAQKMEAIGKLAGGIAHDFNNLLVSIVGYGEFLEAGLADRPQLREQVREILRAGERASALTAQLLAFSRKQVLQPRVLDLNAILSDLGSMLARLIGEDVRMVNCLADGELRVKVDQGQLEQVVLNLVTNARDAMRGGGVLTIETREEQIEAERPEALRHLAPGRYAALLVSDTGEGMDEETRKRAFDPFFTTKPMGRGTGLGLATIYGIARQSGGDAAIESEPGEGTRVRVLLPLTTEALAAASPAAETAGAAAGGDEVVLVAEDEEAVAGLVRKVLEGKGYSVHVARTGAEALDLVRDGGLEFDLLLSDVVMPRMSGPELVRELRALGRSFRVLFVSGYLGDALEQQGLLDEGVELIAKPFSPVMLAARVRRVLDSD
jgi:PAS domain S-box-containing protein